MLETPLPPIKHKQKTTVRLHVQKRSLTWTQGAAGALLHRHALAERSSVEGRRIRAGAGAFLHASPTAHVTGRPVGPRWPAPVHWFVGEENGEEMLREFPPQKLAAQSFIWSLSKSVSEWNNYAVIATMINGARVEFFDLSPKTWFSDWLISSVPPDASRKR